MRQSEFDQREISFKLITLTTLGLADFTSGGCSKSSRAAVPDPSERTITLSVRFDRRVHSRRLGTTPSRKLRRLMPKSVDPYSQSPRGRLAISHSLSRRRGSAERQASTSPCDRPASSQNALSHDTRTTQSRDTGLNQRRCRRG